MIHSVGHASAPMTASVHVQKAVHSKEKSKRKRSPPPPPPPWEKEKREARREEWKETRARGSDRRARCQKCLGGVEEVPCRGCG